MKDQRLKKLANLIVNYSTKVKPGEYVFVICDEASIPWMVEIVKAVIKAGAYVETKINSQEVTETILKYGKKEQVLNNYYIMEEIVKKADVLLSARGGRNTRINSNIDAEKIKISKQGEGTWRKIMLKREEKGSLRWCGTQFPTFSDAQEANMSLADYEDFVYNAGLLNKKDPASEWLKIRRKQEKWVKYLNKKKELHIISKGTDIRVSVEGRRWISCDGKNNFPDGEIFTGPVDNKIDGFITFDFPGIYSGREIEGIRLDVKEGKIIKASAKKGEDLLLAILETDKGASRFGEVAIGTNYGIKKFTRNMLFDEKIGGTLHMAIGSSFPEAGGKNQSAVHWDMLCDMRKYGEIYADDELFYKNGKFCI